ncbi:HAD-like domain-containing protein [Roridomyces roridus]|uniref:HAD-like domain-containing protein n=1 Tax=Roridomyces roridus TaxID=1738132 RepID=A0AAD7C508_9AGAR|nr:HAD-like domain-containing protein [Roridomyces roridus]
MPSTTFHVDAALFDMDGTLLESKAGVEGAWYLFKETYPDIDLDYIFQSNHGVRTVESLRLYCGLTDPEEIEREAARFETAIVTTAAKSGQGIVLIPGVQEAMGILAPVSKLPNPRWAICTSATRSYATTALGLVKISIPDVFVAAEDVTQGKPCPDPYLLGAKRCGVKPENCVVFEDAPAGVISGKAAGCKTIGFLTSHTRAQMEVAKPDFLVKDMSSVTLKLTENGIDITVNTD